MTEDHQDRLGEPRPGGCIALIAVMAGLVVITGVGIVLFAQDLLSGPYHEIGEEPPFYVTEYDAEIGPEDMVDDRGEALASVQAILARDRENVELRGIRQPGDSMSRQDRPDRAALPSPSPAVRWAILEDVQISGTDDARKALLAGGRPIHVTIYFNERYDRYIASIRLNEADAPH
ncbi:hypothetical protein [Altererythrobacter sp. Z27]|uniref:hypothetical protein n=1 Tax=Altererythrobacter sp. Z27 TaxID=3461147 RepID=UPI004043E3BA